MPPKEALGFELWREPDEMDPDHAVWYGPEGSDGDVATVAARTGSYEYRVADIQNVEGLIEEPQAPFLATSTWVDLVDAVRERLGISADAARARLDKLGDNKKLRIAAGIGVAALSERGGEEDWVDSLAEGVTSIE